MQRAWSASTVVLLVGVVAHFSLLASAGATSALVLGAAVLLVAGSVAAYLAPRMKLLVGASVAVPGALFFGVGDVTFGLLGHYSNWPGPLNSALAAIVVLPIGLVLCSLGAWIGAAYSMPRADA